MKHLKDSQRKAIFAKLKYGYASKPKARPSPRSVASFPSSPGHKFSVKALRGDAGVKRACKAEVFAALRGDPDFSRVRYKFDTLMFNYGGEGFQVNFSPKQSRDCITGTWRFTDYVETPKGYAYKKELVSDVFGGGDGTAKDMINKFKKQVKK